MKRATSAALLQVLSLVWLTGCTAYTPIDVSEIGNHDRVRVTLTDGNRRDVYDPVLQDDTIRGLVQTGRSASGTQEAPWSVELDRVREVEGSVNSNTGSLFFVLGIAAFAAIAVGSAVCADGCGMGS